MAWQAQPTWCSAATSSRSSTRSTRSSSTRPARRSSSPDRRRARRTAGSPSSRRSPAGSPPASDYEVDEKKRTVGVLEPGIEKVEDYLGIDNLYESANTPLISFLNNAIKADALFKRDKDYVVMNGEVLIVDEHTGRILIGPPLQRGHPPGHRGEGGRRGQGREPDPRHRHAAELLPALQEALGHDRYRRDRGRRVHVDVQARRGRDPDEPADAAHRPDRPRLQERDRRSSSRSPKTSTSATRRASPSSSARPASRSASTSPSCSPRRASSTRSSTRRTTRVKPRSWPRPVASAPSPSPPTWPVVVPTSCSAATPSSSRSPR